MMSEIYIKLFEGLIERISYLANTQDFENELNQILDKTISDIGEIWSFFKKNNYIISGKKRKEFQWKLEKHHLDLNKLVEKYRVLRKCTKCKKELLETTEFFYLDRQRSRGLSTICKECHRTKQKERYYKKKENEIKKSH